MKKVLLILCVLAIFSSSCASLSVNNMPTKKSTTNNNEAFWTVAAIVIGVGAGLLIYKNYDDKHTDQSGWSR